jgi:hypothetical protein
MAEQGRNQNGSAEATEASVVQWGFVGLSWVFFSTLWVPYCAVVGHSDLIRITGDVLLFGVSNLVGYATLPRYQKWWANNIEPRIAVEGPLNEATRRKALVFIGQFGTWGYGMLLVVVLPTRGPIDARVVAAYLAVIGFAELLVRSRDAVHFSK